MLVQRESRGERNAGGLAKTVSITKCASSVSISASDIVVSKSIDCPWVGLLLIGGSNKNSFAPPNGVGCRMRVTNVGVMIRKAAWWGHNWAVRGCGVQQTSTAPATTACHAAAWLWKGRPMRDCPTDRCISSRFNPFRQRGTAAKSSPGLCASCSSFLCTAAETSSLEVNEP